MNDDTEKKQNTVEHGNITVLIDEDRIARRVAELATRIESDLAALEGEITLVPIMTGSMLFVSDLIRRLKLPLRIAPVTVQSYPGTATTSRGAHLQTPIPEVLRDSHVVLVDDILDSGGTLSMLRRLVEAVEPRSIRACVLLDKQVERSHEVGCEYAGFEIADEFVVGYGLDHDGLYRNLPYIGTLKALEHD